MLTQVEADAYIAESKHFPLPAAVPIAPGVDNTYELNGANGADYLLDVWRGTIRLTRVKYQNRVRVATVLVRIDDARHTNPDGERFDGLHIHVYREGYETKWAQQLDPEVFTDSNSVEQLFRDFCRFCNIDDTQVTVQAGMI